MECEGIYCMQGGTVYVWDVRQFARPVYSFSRSGSIQRLSWTPTRWVLPV